MELLNDRYGIWYNDLYFYIVHSENTLQSPITGYLIKNKNKLNYTQLIENHLKTIKNKRSLPCWLEYTEFIRCVRYVPYKVFMKEYSKSWCNRGYSYTLLNPQKAS